MSATPPRIPAVLAIDVPDIGAFKFKVRKIGDEVAILAKYDAMLEGVREPSALLDSIATAIATYRTLALEYPAGWEPESVMGMDILADNRIGSLLTIYGALRAREDTFRPGKAGAGQGGGEGAGGKPGELVPPKIQSPAD